MTRDETGGGALYGLLIVVGLGAATELLFGWNLFTFLDAVTAQLIEVGRDTAARLTR